MPRLRAGKMKIHGGNLGGTEDTGDAFGEWARVSFLKDGTEAGSSSLQ